ncbi:diguanylate cyclase [Aquabacterium sp.]|uniref:diguanylate cyclase n=1 Tax=Aquabacterium sp. TaxID=1872578 RepID=UPI0035AE3B69
MSCPTWLQPVSRVVLGADPQMHRRVLRTLMAAYVYLICMLLMMRGVWLGMVDERLATCLNLYMTAGVIGFYAVLRADLTVRCRDSSLALPQCLFAITSIVAAYIIVGPARGTVLLLLALVMAFGMFSLTPRQTLAVGAFAVILLGAAMAVMCRIKPDDFPIQVEAIKFGIALSVLPTMALVAHQVSQLRERLLKQRRELHEALARVQELATRDSLTGLINRRHMQELLDQELKRQERSGASFCLAIVDLDFFKRINDTHGHHVGDEVLCGFVRESIEVLRNADMMARWGGEEFLILFPETRAEQALNGLMRLREHMAGKALSETVPDLVVTFSAGLAEHVNSHTLRQTLERADRALYAAKASGRNRSVLAPVS